MVYHIINNCRACSDNPLSKFTHQYWSGIKFHFFSNSHQQPKFLGLQVVLVLLLVLVHAIPESPLSVSVNVHLHDACLNGITDVFQRGARTTVENERHGLVALAAQLLLVQKIMSSNLDGPIGSWFCIVFCAQLQSRFLWSIPTLSITKVQP